MTDSRDAFQRLLNESQKRQAEIKRHCEQFTHYLSENVDFSSRADDCRNRLNRDLEIVENYIIELSASCLRRIDDFNNSIQGIDIELNKVSGTLQRIKWNASAKAMNPLLANGNSSPLKETFDEATINPQISVPSYPFDLNLDALKNIGSEIQSETSDSLIRVVPEESEIPQYWTNSNDFFVQKTTLSSE